MTWRISLLTVLGCLVVYLALLISGVAPAESARTFVTDSLMTPAGWRETLVRTTPMLFLGAAVFLALRAGLFNIGADGQFVIGALAGTSVVLTVPGPVGIVLALIAGALAGALWAFPAGWIKAYRGGHEVITTIMLNNIAGFFSIYILNTFLKSSSTSSPTTPRLPESSTLPNLIEAGPFRLNVALPIGIVVVVALWYWLSKTTSGYELRATGGNPEAARTAGVQVKTVILRSMMSSGCIAGLAGVLQVLAYDRRFYPGISPGYGFDALGVALLAGGNPLGILASSLLFGVIARGTTAVGIIGVPKGLSGILVAVIIIVFAAVLYRKGATPRD